MCYMMIVTNDKKVNAKIKDLVNTYFINVFLLPDSTSYDDAIRVTNNYFPEIILLDITLKDANPFDLQKKLQTIRPNCRFITIDHEENFSHIKQSVQLGSLDYLTFPFNEQETLESIHRAIISLNQISLLGKSTKDRVSTNNDMTYSMIDYIHTNYQNQLTLDKLADYLHLNKYYVSNLFKKETGMTFNNYLTDYRIEQAKVLLKESTDLLADISHQVGYSDPAYFSRIFKKKTNMSPISYRQLYYGDTRPIVSMMN
ncbi:helix-turn-helix domain-containing protein [Vagococcus sp. CY52-2]|uniref:AraC family transcriptional regulator n=1 Tax=Vagococcus sp. CY52-2 TaxID=2925838 RepID=UPI001F564A36|nr:helix-turn-helix domain-containing protein [Vagococcus sp. CY52-2]UNM89286.1 AraC family transcriptional regulator [Vagococcus sp. CY52-2]